MPHVGNPEASPQESDYLRQGDNLPNVIQYLKEQYPERLENILSDTIGLGAMLGKGRHRTDGGRTAPVTGSRMRHLRNPSRQSLLPMAC